MTHPQISNEILCLYCHRYRHCNYFQVHSPKYQVGIYHEGLRTKKFGAYFRDATSLLLPTNYKHCTLAISGQSMSPSKFFTIQKNNLYGIWIMHPTTQLDALSKREHRHSSSLNIVPVCPSSIIAMEAKRLFGLVPTLKI